MSRHDGEVQPWTGVRTFHPEMRLEARAPAEQVLAALSRGLGDAGFSIKHPRTDGFLAQHTAWLSLLAGTFNRTELEVGLAGDGVVLVEASGQGDRAAGAAADGLSAGVRILREQGVEVVVHPWVVPESRRKGKRR